MPDTIIELPGQYKHHLDKFGWYEVNGRRYLHKITAGQTVDQQWDQVKFNFNDEVFDSYDWTKEPEPSVPLTEFYRRRAQRLRDKYEYLVLMYSGGPDSQNVLDSFVDNDIFIDEIVNVNSYDRTRVTDRTVHNADWIFNAKPVLDRLVHNGSLRSRITVIDEIELGKQCLRDLELRGDYELAFDANGWTSQVLFKGTWVKYVPHLWQMILDGKKLGVIIASEKPRLLIDQKDRYFTSWFDLSLVTKHLALSEDVVLRNLDFDEQFYCDPSCMDLMAKQLHVLKNFMEHHRQDEFYGDHVHRYRRRRTHTCVSKYNKMHLSYAAFHKIIYPKWNPAIVTPKPAVTGTKKPARMEDNWWLDKFSPEETRFWNLCVKKRDSYNHIPLLFSKPIYIE